MASPDILGGLDQTQGEPGVERILDQQLRIVMEKSQLANNRWFKKYIDLSQDEIDQVTSDSWLQIQREGQVILDALEAYPDATFQGSLMINGTWINYRLGSRGSEGLTTV